MHSAEDIKIKDYLSTIQQTDLISVLFQFIKWKRI